MGPLTVACVLRSGGDFTPSWVLALHRGLRQFLPQASLACLTNLRLSILGVETIPLRHGWPRWWSKVELFRPGLFTGPVLYLDLDTLPVGPLDELAAYRGEFAALSDFYRLKDMASGVLAWTPGQRSENIYKRFAASPAAIMNKHPGRSDIWYRKVLGPVDRLQTLFPGQLVSYKAHAKKSIPSGARLVCGHGKPRFSSPAAGWAHRLWRSRCM